MGKVWLSILALILEIAGIAALLTDINSVGKLSIFLLGNTLACMTFSVVLWQLMPQRYRYPLKQSAFFLFIIQFFIPLIGSIGLGTGLILALHLPRSRSRQLWNETDDPALPYRPSEVSSQPLYSQGGLAQVLHEAGSIEKRIRAVMATKQMKNRDAVAILQQALKDTSDDVRLLAYAMLDEKEKIITERIKQTQRALTQAKTDDRQNAILIQQKLLAGHYWEMAYLGLAQGGVRTHFLTQARNHCEAVLAQTEDAASLRLLGRINLETHQPEAAKKAFSEAIEQGLPRLQALPYLAEIAWLQGDFYHIRELLTELSSNSQPIHPTLYGVIDYWLQT